MKTEDLDMNRTQALAAMLATVLREWLTEDEFGRMQELNRGYGHSSGICASHEFCDANMAMHEAFVRVFDREPLLPSDVEANPALAGQEDIDISFWNAAWDQAHRGRLI